MIALIQRVKTASVTVDSKRIANINSGLLVFLGVEKNDSPESAKRLIQRVIGYRVFSDSQGRMNLSLRQNTGDLLIVPQFTLAANTKKGMRPSFSSAASPDDGKNLFEFVLTEAALTGLNVAAGVFGADMEVELINDGPVTFWLQVPPDAA